MELCPCHEQTNSGLSNGKKPHPAKVCANNRLCSPVVAEPWRLHLRRPLSLCSVPGRRVPKQQRPTWSLWTYAQFMQHPRFCFRSSSGHIPFSVVLVPWPNVSLALEVRPRTILLLLGCFCISRLSPFPRSIHISPSFSSCPLNVLAAPPEGHLRLGSVLRWQPSEPVSLCPDS